MRHLYIAFWRPDILEELRAQCSPLIAICDYVGVPYPGGDSFTADTREVDCPACRETFLQALPTGSGKKLTWAAYLASPQAQPRVTLAQRAKKAATADAGWSTAPTPSDPYLAGIQNRAPPVWATEAGTIANADFADVERKVVGGWSTGKIEPEPPGPKDGAWKTS